MKKFPKAEIKEINDTRQETKKLTNFQELIKGQKPFNQAFWGYLVLPLFLSLYFSLFFYLVLYDQIYLWFEDESKFIIILCFLSLIFSSYFFLAGLGTLRAGKNNENLLFSEGVSIFIMAISLVVITISLVILFIFFLIEISLKRW